MFVAKLSKRFKIAGWRRNHSSHAHHGFYQNSSEGIRSVKVKRALDGNNAFASITDGPPHSEQCVRRSAMLNFRQQGPELPSVGGDTSSAKGAIAHTVVGAFQSKNFSPCR